MKELRGTELLLKRYFKRRFKITISTITAFLISGAMGYAASVSTTLGSSPLTITSTGMSVTSMSKDKTPKYPKTTDIGYIGGKKPTNIGNIGGVGIIDPRPLDPRSIKKPQNIGNIGNPKTKHIGNIGNGDGLIQGREEKAQGFKSMASTSTSSELNVKSMDTSKVAKKGRQGTDIGYIGGVGPMDTKELNPRPIPKPKNIGDIGTTHIGDISLGDGWIQGREDKAQGFKSMASTSSTIQPRAMFVTAGSTTEGLDTIATSTTSSSTMSTESAKMQGSESGSTNSVDSKMEMGTGSSDSTKKTNIGDISQNSQVPQGIQSPKVEITDSNDGGYQIKDTNKGKTNTFKLKKENGKLVLTEASGDGSFSLRGGNSHQGEGNGSKFIDLNGENRVQSQPQPLLQSTPMTDTSSSAGRTRRATQPEATITLDKDGMINLNIQDRQVIVNLKEGVTADEKKDIELKTKNVEIKSDEGTAIVSKNKLSNIRITSDKTNIHSKNKEAILVEDGTVDISTSSTSSGNQQGNQESKKIEIKSEKDTGLHITKKGSANITTLRADLEIRGKNGIVVEDNKLEDVKKEIAEEKKKQQEEQSNRSRQRRNLVEPQYSLNIDGSNLKIIAENIGVEEDQKQQKEELLKNSESTSQNTKDKRTSAIKVKNAKVKVKVTQGIDIENKRGEVYDNGGLYATDNADVDIETSNGDIKFKTKGYGLTVKDGAKVKIENKTSKYGSGAPNSMSSSSGDSSSNAKDIIFESEMSSGISIEENKQNAQQEQPQARSRGKRSVEVTNTTQSRKVDVQIINNDGKIITKTARDGVYINSSNAESKLSLKANQIDVSVNKPQEKDKMKESDLSSRFEGSGLVAYNKGKLTVEGTESVKIEGSNYGITTRGDGAKVEVKSKDIEIKDSYMKKQLPLVYAENKAKVELKGVNGQGADKIIIGSQIKIEDESKAKTVDMAKAEMEKEKAQLRAKREAEKDTKSSENQKTQANDDQGRENIIITNGKNSNIGLQAENGGEIKLEAKEVKIYAYDDAIVTMNSSVVDVKHNNGNGQKAEELRSGVPSGVAPNMPSVKDLLQVDESSNGMEDEEMDDEDMSSGTFEKAPMENLQAGDSGKPSQPSGNVESGTDGKTKGEHSVEGQTIDYEKRSTPDHELPETPKPLPQTSPIEQATPRTVRVARAVSTEPMAVTIENGEMKDNSVQMNEQEDKTLSSKEKSLVEIKGDSISIFGDIMASHGSEIKIEKRTNGEMKAVSGATTNSGNVEIALNQDEITKYRAGNFSASNKDWALVDAKDGAKVTINLKGTKDDDTKKSGENKKVGSLFIGVLDYNKHAQESSQGDITINMDKDATLVPLGSSSVTHLNLGNGTVDLSQKSTIHSREQYSKLYIKELEGEGTFKLHLDSSAKDKKSNSVIYIESVKSSSNSEMKTGTEKSNNKIMLDVQKVDIEKLNGDKLGFALVSKNAKDKVTFESTNTKVEERGIQNVDIKIEKEDYKDSDFSTFEDDHIFKEETTKDKFKEGSKWSISREKTPEPPKPAPTPMPKPENNKPLPKPNNDNDITRAVVSSAKSNYYQIVNLDTMNKRTGDITFAKGESGVWVRINHEKVGEDGVFKLENNQTQIGYDFAKAIKNGENHSGIAFDYSRGDMKYKNIKGHSDVDKYTLSTYSTNVYDNGIYTDLTAKVGAVHNKFDITTTNQGYHVDGKVKTGFVGTGFEAGKKIAISKKSYIEPQAQLQYTYVMDTEYTTNQGTKVKLDDVHSLIGRVGLRVGHDFYKNDTKNNTIYARVDINHEFLGEQNVSARDITGSIDRKYENSETWTSLGAGFAKDITKDFHIYTEFEKQFGSSRNNSSWQGNLGFKYKLGK